MILPPDWPIGINVFSDYRNYWPVHWLKTIARLPQRCQQWMGEGQTFANSTSAKPIANTPYGGFLLFSPLISLPEEFCVMETPDGGLLHFYALVPLTPQELRFKNNFGLEALLLQFKQNAGTAIVTDRILYNRPSLVEDDTAPVEIDLDSDSSSFHHKKTLSPASNPAHNPAITAAQMAGGGNSANDASIAKDIDEELTELSLD